MPIEVTKNEIRARIRQPGRFKEGAMRNNATFARDTLKEERPQIFSIIGILKTSTRGSTSIQSIRFPRDQGWTLDSAKKWLKDHNFKVV